MAAAISGIETSRLVDKAMLRDILEEQARAAGYFSFPNASALHARELMLAAGVRPEDNIGSRELMRMRYGADE